MARDFQRQKVYAAESIAFPRADQTLMSLPEIRVMVKGVVNGPYWQSHKCYKRIKVKDGRGTRRGYASSEERSISLPKFARYESYVLHELAHLLTEHTHPGASAHGRFWCKHLLALVNEHIGRLEAVRLHYAFITGGVEVHTPSFMLD
ncbi:hypothetical protein A3709_20795 [Halioglobus sp. HI00S01]|uniref:hypothetical protein n=1 Tax=Halioglobus sp. HI00S01 TaxID=1822214 RepID=UPI0007C25CB7|nr:hypothetical protein [Halioglobus sp. HI00S01]KZX58053.1 hypothetical protein A3709_20795 [Halioglobus sp. HI00S01]